MSKDRLATTAAHRRWPLAAGALALFLLLAVAYLGSADIRASRGAAITGDEPFYLLTTQSLLADGDLDLTDQYAQRSYRSFFDHPWGLWKQSAPNASGELLSPHNVGLSVFLIPGFWAAGLLGAQLQLLVASALTFSLAFVLAARLTGSVLISWLVTASIGLSASAFIYATEIYPEVPSALVLVLAILLVMQLGTERDSLRQVDLAPREGSRAGPQEKSKPTFGVGRAVLLVVLLSAMAWLGVKYIPLAGVVAAFFWWKATPDARKILFAGGALSAGLYIWFHLSTYGYLTPYSLNLVYAGERVPALLDSHVALDRAYRLWGLFIDQRFGIGRWAPILLAAIPGAVLAWRGLGRPAHRSLPPGSEERRRSVSLPLRSGGRSGGGSHRAMVGTSPVRWLGPLSVSLRETVGEGYACFPHSTGGEARGRNGIFRLILVLIAVQLIIATFVAVTMMGWWFPGRTLMTVLPLLVLPISLLVLWAGPRLRAVLAALALHSLAITGALAYAGHARDVVIAVDPFEMSAFFFRGLSPLFPNYTSWSAHTWAFTIAWIVLGAAAISALATRRRAWWSRVWDEPVGASGRTKAPPKHQFWWGQVLRRLVRRWRLQDLCGAGPSHPPFGRQRHPGGHGRVVNGRETPDGTSSYLRVADRIAPR